MKLYRTTNGVFVEQDAKFYPVPATDWDQLICSADLRAQVHSATSKKAVLSIDPATILAPVVSQEVGAAGVTYYRSRNARMEESKTREAQLLRPCLAAERPELFFKATGVASSGHGVLCVSVPTQNGRCRNRS